MTKKVLVVFGTRPEAIKMAPLVKKLEAAHDSFETVVAVTGQHREMLDQVLQLFKIEPAFDLNIMQAGQDLFDVTARVLVGLRSILKETKPDLVLVHGDTATSTAAALAAYYSRLPVGHVEAGLRTHNIYSPWPEEMNRQLTGRLSNYHFAPTEKARENLMREGIASDKIFVTGNTVIDALYMILDRIQDEKDLKSRTVDRIKQSGIPSKLITSWEKRNRQLILITGHRRENFGSGFVHLCEAIKELAEKYENADFVYPVHLNPNVREPVHQILGDGGKNNNIYLIKPLDYLEFVYLLNLSHIVLTDSGGIQEEAPGLGKPVLVMRSTTERPEAVDAGTVKLVGTDKAKIKSALSQLMDSPDHYEKMSKANNPYGDGKACSRILNHLKHISTDIL